MNKVAKAKTKTFEGSLDELESIIYELESGALTLDESIKHYKKGIELAKYCSDALKKAEQEVYVLEQDEIKKIDGDIENA